ncbi:uncharacterized protein LOC141647121 isoform X2 [Silene latifolia]|uniref:uncharacterized protein LOC141647121 isoform X2 n=1 Tax=Silene latifolia TaxID=37657 RepID=UPI003D77F105
MFKPQKHKSRNNSRNKLDFQFSDFQCIKVPRGWDKLFVSIAQVETGKTIAKSGKTSVINGTCSWTDIFCGAVYIPQENEDSKEAGSSFIKFVVAMGSSRSGALGEVTIDMRNHASTGIITPLSLQLKKCQHGTSLQFNVECLTEREDVTDAQISEPFSISREVNDDDSPLSNPGASKDFFKAAEVRTEELKGEDRLSDRNRKRLTDDVNLLRNEVFEQSRAQKRYSMEIAALQQESSDSEQDIQHIEGLLETSGKKQATAEDLKIIGKDMDEVQTEMEQELRFLKKSNANLTEQLQKTQESNVELLSILTELEGIVESQKLEIESLSSQKRKLEENSNLGASKDSGFRDSTMQATQAPEHNPSDIENIKHQLQQLNETQEELESAIQVIQQLEEMVDEKENEIERLQDLTTVSFSDYESKWALTVAAKEEEITNLKTKLADAIKNCQNEESKVAMGNTTQMVKEIDFLRRKVEDLENYCDERSEANETKSGDMRIKEDGTEDQHNGESELSTSEVGTVVYSDLSKSELSASEVEALKLDNMRKNEEIEGLQTKICTLEDRIAVARDENHLLKESLEIEKAIFSESIKELKKEIVDLSSSLELQISDNKVLQRLSSELEKGKHDVEEHLLELEQENMQSIKELKKEIFDLSSSLELQISDNKVLQTLSSELEKGKHDVEEHLLEREQENMLSIKELKKEVVDLSSSLELQISDNKVLQRLSSELEKGKHDVEEQLLELEQENVQLSERILALEAQVRYLTDEKETYFLKLRHSENQLVNLHDEIKGLETEIEVHKVYLRQRLEETRTRWLEAQEECEYLKQVNPKLQLTAENVIEECNLLQKINGELKRQNMEMHTRCGVLESQLKDSEGRLFECAHKVDALEEDFSNILEEVVLKEKGLKSELDSLLTEDKNHREKLMHEHTSLNEMYSHKVIEVENLQRELVHLIDQIYAPQDGKETPTSDTVLELSALRSEKAKLEIALHDLQGKFALCQNNMSTVVSNFEAKIKALTKEFSASRKNEELLIIKCDKLSLLLENAKSNDAEYKRVISRHETNHKASEYERQQLAREVSTLKEQMQRTALLQDELVTLQASLNAAKFEYEKLKASAEWQRRDHEELKTGKKILVQKITNMEKALLDLEDCKCRKIALEEKVTRLERDLAEREALCVQDAKLKFELSRTQRANSELQMKMEHLKQHQKEYLNRINVVEEQLKHKIQTTLGLSKSFDNPSDLADAASVVEQSTDYKERMLRITRSESIDNSMKIQSLEDVLCKAFEASDMYRSQIKRFLSEEQSVSSDNPQTSSVDSGVNSKMGRSNDIASLELELSDLRDKYFQLSVKYADVEAQREELVVKLKSKNNKKSWFSK